MTEIAMSTISLQPSSFTVLARWFRVTHLYQDMSDPPGYILCCWTQRAFGADPGKSTTTLVHAASPSSPDVQAYRRQSSTSRSEPRHCSFTTIIHHSYFPRIALAGTLPSQDVRLKPTGVSFDFQRAPCHNPPP